MPRIHEMLERKFLAKEDCGEDGMVVTVTDFERVNVAMDDQPPEHKWTMKFKELPKPLVLNSTNLQLCEKIFGSDNTDDWLGKKLVVYSDPNISFGGKLVGGIRVRAHRVAQAPRQMAGNGGDDFDAPTTGAGSTNTLANVEQDLWDATLNGLEAFKLQWLGKTDTIREHFRNNGMFAKMKLAAENIEKAPKRQPADDFSDIPQ